MLQSYDASAKKNSEVQILTGTVKEVQTDTVTVTVPVGYNSTKEFTISTDALNLTAAPTVGQPITALGLDNEDGTFTVDAEKQNTLAQKTTQFVEFERCKENPTTKKKTMEHDVFLVFPVTSATQVKIDETKKAVTLPANVGNTTVWLNFYSTKFSHFDNYENEGKKKLGLKAYAEMLKKKLDALADGEVLLVSYTGRFEDSVKDEATGKYTYSPATPREKDGKLIYSVFGKNENALGTMVNTAVTVPKSFVFTTRETAAEEATQTPTKAPEEATKDLSEEEEMALLQQAMGV